MRFGFIPERIKQWKNRKDGKASTLAMNRGLALFFAVDPGDCLVFPQSEQVRSLECNVDKGEVAAGQSILRMVRYFGILKKNIAHSLSNPYNE